MKGKVIQKIVAISITFVLVMANFMNIALAVGENIQGQTTATSNNNVEYGTYFKNEKGEKITSLDMKASNLETSLYIYLNVKNEGYISGAKIDLENANFKIKEATSEYINKIEGNTITFNQINAGRSVEIEVKIEMIRNNNFDISGLNRETKVKLSAIYRDSKEKDIPINTVKTVTLKLVKETETLESNIEIITNKVMQVAGEEKRVVQVAIHTGLKGNSYPLKEINGNIQIPSIGGKAPKVEAVIALNSMSKGSYQYQNGILKFEYTNIATEKNTVLWEKEGTEGLIVTCLYDKDAKVEGSKIEANIQATIYDDTTATTKNLTVTVDNQEKDAVITSKTVNQDSIVYKGKLYNGIDREFTSKHTVQINIASVVDKLEIREQNKLYSQQENKLMNETDINYMYKNTQINKEDMTKTLGKDGKIKITDEKGNVIATIDNNTQANEKGMMVVDYGEGKENIVITTTKPIKAGKIDITNTKIIKQNEKTKLKDKTVLSTQLYVKSNLQEQVKNITSEAKTTLEESQTEVDFQVNKKELSTVVENTVELKAILKSNSEKNDLFENPVIRISFPVDITNVKINSVELAYENELKIKNYTLDGNKMTIELEGKQTQYKDLAIDGANVIINATFGLNKKASTKEDQFMMVYTNQNANSYPQGTEDGTAIVGVKITAPTDITVIHTIKELSIEEMEQGVTTEKLIPLNTEKQTITPQIEIMNNKPDSIENVKVLGTFPTNNEKNTMNIVLTEAMTVEGVKVYYTENAAATDDITNVANAWKEEITNPEKVQKYLIIVDKLEPQAGMKASYKAEIPAGLEYNKQATHGYQVTYTDSATKVNSTIKATDIKLTTGKGPIMDIGLTTKIGKDILKSGDSITAGEVIQYVVEISNTGTEDVQNAKISIPVPEGTTYVRAKQHYEYTGSVYYEEVAGDKIEDIIATIPVGSKTTKQYEIRVNKDIKDNQKIKNVSQITYGEITKTSDEIELISKAGNIRASVKRITDRSVNIYENAGVQYFAIIENTSNQKLDNVNIQTNLPAEVEVQKLNLITGMEAQDITDNDIVASGNELNYQSTQSEVRENQSAETNLKSEEIAYSSEVNIGSLEAGEVKVLSYFVHIKDKIDAVNFSVIAKQNGRTYRSNNWEDIIHKTSVDVTMTSNIQDKYIKAGDIIEYTITVKNNGMSMTPELLIKDMVPSQLTIKSITKNGEEITIPQANTVVINDQIGSMQETVVKIQAIVDYSEGRTEAEPITNQATIEVLGEQIASTPIITHIIEADVENNDGENNNNTNNDIEDNNIATGNRVISGMAWEDRNANGKKDEDEYFLSGIKVRLLNVETNQFVKDTSDNVIEITTDSNGIYVINNIGNGKYIAIFDYDTVAYTITKYKAENVAETENSDVIKNQITLEGKQVEVTSTDIITIQNENVSDMNIGLMKLQNFDLTLDKYVSKIMVQNTAGNTVREYTDETMAKLEIDAKAVNGSTAVIEYKMKITNAGEVEGYAKKIVDYMSNGFTFNSEINKDWYQLGENLYNASLANEKIMPGETKTLTLILTKNITENNVGLMNNTAEIAEDYNELGIADSNSAPGNNTKGENDFGSADVIISIRTGAEIILYSTFYMLIILGVVAIVTIPIIKKTKHKNTKKLDKI